jgi:arsenate reductase
MTTLYGIASCDTVKKARRWLDEHEVEYRFHDLRRDGLDRERLQRWERRLGWETLLNRRGTTWRGLPEAVRAEIDRGTALTVMLQQPAIIRRPLLEHGHTLRVGFTSDGYRALFG